MNKYSNPFSDDVLQNNISLFSSFIDENNKEMQSSLKQLEKKSKPFEVMGTIFGASAVLRGLIYENNDIILHSFLLASTMLYSVSIFFHSSFLNKSSEIQDKSLGYIGSISNYKELLKARNECRFSLRSYLYEKRYGNAETRKREACKMRHVFNSYRQLKKESIEFEQKHLVKKHQFLSIPSLREHTRS